jgi:hypothetical protein
MHKYMRSSLKGIDPEIEVTIPVDPASRRFVNPQEHGIGRLLQDTGYLPRDPKVARMSARTKNR